PIVPAPTTAMVFTSILWSPLDGPSLHKSPVSLFIKTQHHLRASNDHRPANEIRLLGHEFDVLRARGRMILHFPRAIELISRIQELSVIAVADQLIQFGLGQSLFVQIA